MDKLESIIKKAQNLDLKAFKEGKYNYDNPKDEIEELALERAKICAGCDSLMDEPISEFRIKDKIEEISNKSCEECGCISAYLVRQNVKTCKLNKW